MTNKPFAEQLKDSLTYVDCLDVAICALVAARALERGEDVQTLRESILGEWAQVARAWTSGLSEFERRKLRQKVEGIL